jgi:hypothetical protein
LLWQRYLPPETDEAGRAIKLRLHALLSPAGGRFLSIHGVVGTRPVPSSFPPGVQPDDGTLIQSFSKGARYRRVGAEIEREAAEAAAELGAALSAAVRERFETGPSDAGRAPEAPPSIAGHSGSTEGNQARS